MRLPSYWLKGGFWGLAYLAIFIFLKSICQPEWCFADFFLPWFFEPLLILDFFLPGKFLAFLGRHLLLTAFAFWFVLGAVLGLIYGLFKKKG